MSDRISGLNIALVAIGGAIGASLRHGCSLATDFLGGGEEAWLLMVNLIGAFALGFIFTTLDPEAPRDIDVERSPGELDADPAKDRGGAFVAVGLLGAFTTYSALAVLLLERFQAGDTEGGIALLAVSLVGGLAMVALGVRVGRRKAGRRQEGPES